MINSQIIVEDIKRRYKINAKEFNIKINSFNVNKKINDVNIYDVINKEKCPYCGKKSSSPHQNIVKHFYDVSIINNRPNFLYINYFGKKYQCKNPFCSNNVFTPNNPFVKGKERYTYFFKKQIYLFYTKKIKKRNISTMLEKEYYVFINRNKIANIINEFNNEL